MSKRPRSLLSALLGTAVVVTAVLLWFGWKTVSDHTMVEQQRVRDRRETSADAMAAGSREKLAEAAERLSGWLARRKRMPGAKDPGLRRECGQL